MDLLDSLIVPDPPAGRSWSCHSPQASPRTRKTNQIGKLTGHADSSRSDDKYTKRFSRLPSLSNPSFWDGGAPRIPDLPWPSSPRPSAVHQQADTQYPGLVRSIECPCRGLKLQKALSRKSLPRKPHPLSYVTTLESAEASKDRAIAVEDTKATFTPIVDVKVRPNKANVALNMDLNKKAPKRKLSCIVDGSQFDRADKKISLIAQRILPDLPHLVSVPTERPYMPTFPFENLRTPFEDWEVRHLQHMTLISSNSRGVAWVKGDWEDEINAFSPHNSGPQSGTATPHSERDPNKPRTKMTLADYKAGKRSASSSQSVLANSTQRPQKDQKSSNLPIPAVSPTQDMIDRIVQSHATDTRQPNTERKDRVPAWKADTRCVPPPQHAHPENTPNDRLVQQQVKVNNAKDAKRALDAPESTRPEKRSKMDPSNAPRPSAQRETSASRAKPILDPAASTNSQKSSVAPEKLGSIKQRETTIPGKKNEKPINGPKKEKTRLENGPVKEAQKQSIGPEKKGRKAETSPEKKKEKVEDGVRLKLETAAEKEEQKPESGPRGPIKVKEEDPMDVLPPLLSPLPPPYDKPQAHFDAIGGATSGTEKTVGITPPSSADDMPSLLSPLPEGFCERLNQEAEVAIARYLEEEKKKLESQKRQAEIEATSVIAVEQNNNINTVEARHERSRQPDAPGVARKTTKSSTPKPRKPKKAEGAPGDAEGAKASLVVKLKYKKKRNAKNVERILNMKPHPVSESLPLPRSRDKKRTHPSDDDTEPAAKRAKPPATLEVSKAQTPRNTIKSPAPSASPSSQKSLLETPKKSDSAKCVAMRRIDSSDGRVRTPQGPSPSAPASTEKARASINVAENEAQKAAFEKYLGLGKASKRQADLLLRSKEKEANRGPISEEDKRLGTVVAIESVVAFMLGFNAFDRHRQIERKLTLAEHWSGVIPLLAFATDRARAYPQLHTLTLLLNVVSRESLDRIYTEHLSAESPSKEPAYMKLREELIQNSRTRKHVLQQYIEQKKVGSVDFVLSVADAKTVAISVLEQFCTENKVEWTPKI